MGWGVHVGECGGGWQWDWFGRTLGSTALDSVSCDHVPRLVLNGLRWLMVCGGQVGFGWTHCVRPNLTQALGVFRCTAFAHEGLMILPLVGMQVCDTLSL